MNVRAFFVRVRRTDELEGASEKVNLVRDFASMRSRLQSLFPAKNDFTLFEKHLIRGVARSSRGARHPNSFDVLGS